MDPFFGGEDIINQSHMRPIDAFIQFSKADGSFNYSSHFEKTIKLGKENIIITIPKEISQNVTSEDIKFNLWVAVIALAYMEKYLNAEREEWKLIADKTKKFIKKHLVGVNIENLIQLAKSVC